MDCLFLENRCGASCRALKEVYTPSLFELEEYCKSVRYKRCPLYLGLIHHPWADSPAAVPQQGADKQVCG